MGVALGRQLITGVIICAFLILAVYTAGIVKSGHQRTEQLLQDLNALQDDPAIVTLLPAEWIADLLEVEDPNFWMHPGLDLRTPGGGFTTLTQALVKIHYFERFEPGLAKYRQSVLALVMERELSKQQILSLFLESAYLGNHSGRAVTGFRRAAQVYFGTPIEEISHEQFLSLVAMLIAPNRFSIQAQPAANTERVQRIRRLLAGACQPQGLRDVYYESCGI